MVLTLALRIGANAAMFGVVDRLMFRPHAYLRDPATVHRVYFRSDNRGTLRTRSRAEYPRYLDVRGWTTSFSQYAAFTNRVVAVGVGDASRERPVAMVSASFFDFFDARPTLGRFFIAAEDTTPRGTDVAVLGHAFWTTAFGGRGANAAQRSANAYVATYNWAWMEIMVRRKPGVTITQASADLSQAYARAGTSSARWMHRSIPSRSRSRGRWRPV